jgi:phage tail protein X
MGCDIKRGRDDEVSEIAASTMTIHLDNITGRFTPGSSSWVNLDLGCVIRRTAIVDGVSHVRFTGYVDAIDSPDWVNAPFEKTVTVTASDRLGRMGSERAGTMLSPLDYETLAVSSPHFYYPMNEEADATQLTSIGSDPQPLLRVTSGGTMTLASAQGVPSDTRQVPKFESIFDDAGNLTSGADYFSAIFASPVTYDITHAICISAWFRVDATWANTPVARVAELTDGTSSFLIRINASGVLEGVVGAVTVTGPGIAAGGSALYHAVLVAIPGVTARLYVNGTQYVGGICSAVTVSNTAMYIGGPWHGSISNVSVYSHNVLSQADVDALYSAGLTGLDGMMSDAAMAAVATWAGVPAAELVSSPPAQTRVGNIQIAGKSAAEVLRLIAAAEGGIIFADGSGILQFHTRPKRWNYGAAQYTIPNGDIVDAFGLSYNDKFIVNESKVTRTGGSMSRYLDATSQTKRGIYAEAAEYAFYTDAETVSRARMRVASYKDPQPRLNGIPVRIYTSLDAEDLCDLDIGSLVSIAGLSADAPTALAEQWIEGVSETQSINDWVITFSTSPILATETASSGYFRVGSGATSQIGSSAMIAP